MRYLNVGINQLNTRIATEISSDANENQNDVERTLLPLTVDWRAYMLLGSTYTTSFCCR